MTEEVEPTSAAARTREEAGPEVTAVTACRIGPRKVETFMAGVRRPGGPAQAVERGARLP
ncbi:hypothetical protein GT204_15365 [Streptomyces sp. SID4919]|uniref:hypothetical protein n=1 Tax=unclassified Streptomyces TaxID=2593676 RepID=UPI00136AC387|nr:MULTISPECIES: hypothetical protein [unclassified Streptomyces]MYY10244.1 hypothetical protein [Streptomyces sp. SID4919]